MLPHHCYLLRYVVALDIPSFISSIPRPLRAAWPTIIPELLAFVTLFGCTVMFSHPAIYAPLFTRLEFINDAAALALYRVLLG
jgi:hypothetical protein